MPRWTIADFAALYSRCVTVPIYPTSTPQQAAYIINNADVRILFVGEQAQHDAAVEVAAECPQLERIVVMSDDVELADHSLVCRYNDFVGQASAEAETELAQRLEQTSMDDLLTLIYTSGTTGTPKGVMLDYANIASQLEGHDTNLALDEGG